MRITVTFDAEASHAGDGQRQAPAESVAVILHAGDALGDGNGADVDRDSYLAGNGLAETNASSVQPCRHLPPRRPARIPQIRPRVATCPRPRPLVPADIVRVD